MSSAGASTSPSKGPQKKRRLHKIEKACDLCRQKKIRCDGGAADAGSRCSYCVAHSSDCTYNSARKRSGRSTEGLEERVRKLEHIIRKIRPDIDLERELESLNVADCSSACGRAMQDQTHAVAPSANGHWLAVGPFDVDVDVDSVVSSEDELSQDMLELIQDVQKMDVQEMRREHVQPEKVGFYGKSSKAHLMHSAARAQSESSGNPRQSTSAHDLRRRIQHRAEFWHPPPIEGDPLGENPADPHLRFPEPALCERLITRFFAHVNPFLPVLHEPTFRGAYADDLHRRDRGFGCIVLLVLATAACQAIEPHRDVTDSKAAWEYFRQVRILRWLLPHGATLENLQILVLAVLFLRSFPQVKLCWTLIGHGIRLGIDIGAHRKKVYKSKPTVRDELWKRAFWALILLDRQLSVSLGRPFTLYDEDMDLDFPVDCDDEYWDTAEHEFQQPEGKPCKASFFIYMLKASQIMAFAVRTIYSIAKTKTRMGFVGVDWEARTVAQLDSAINRWKDSLPDHLKWDPQRKDFVLFGQSVILQTECSFIQIMIHRPFMMTGNRESPLAHPSLCICNNAARACAHVVAAHHSRYPYEPPAHTISAVYLAVVVFLITIWNSKKASPVTASPAQSADALRCVHMLVDVLTAWEKRYPLAARLHDVLHCLMDISDLTQEDQEAAPDMHTADSGTVYSTHSTSTDTTFDASIFPPFVAGDTSFARMSNEQAAPAYQHVPAYTTSMWPTASQPSMPVAQDDLSGVSSDDFLDFQLNSLLYGNIDGDFFGNGVAMNGGGYTNYTQAPGDAGLTGLLSDDAIASWPMGLDDSQATDWNATPFPSMPTDSL